MSNLLKSMKLGKRDVSEIEDSRKKLGSEEKKAKTSLETEEECQKQIQPAVELMQVDLFPRKTGFTTRIGTQMSDAITKAIIECLRRNADVFAFSSADLIGVDPYVALHCLNVDPTA